MFGESQETEESKFRLLGPIDRCRDYYRSEGFPRTRLFHPWARWGGAWWPGKVPCRRRGCRATGPGLGQTTVCVCLSYEGFLAVFFEWDFEGLWDVFEDFGPP